MTLREMKILHMFLFWLAVTAFVPPSLSFVDMRSQRSNQPQYQQHFLYRIESESETTNRLSHIMLKVNHLEEAIAYWTEQFGATILTSRRNDKNKYQSCFLALGNGTAADQQSSFALELIATDEKVKLGNALAYIGVSRLLQFQASSQDNLQALLTKPSTSSLAPEPNGLSVQWATSSPGEFLCRIGLRTKDMEATMHFYNDLLGMDVAAADDSMLCLRFASTALTSGVPTTLVFEGTNEPVDHGTCLDHLAIRTSANLQDEYERLQAANVPVFLQPTKMFGSTVLGVQDPNGYKIVLAEEKS